MKLSFGEVKLKVTKLGIMNVFSHYAMLLLKLTGHCLIFCSFLLCIKVPERKAPPLTSCVIYLCLGLLFCEITIIISIS